MAIFLAAGIGIGPEKASHGKTFYVNISTLKIKHLKNQHLPQINSGEFIHTIQLGICQPD